MVEKRFIRLLVKHWCAVCNETFLITGLYLKKAVCRNMGWGFLGIGC